MSVNRDKPHLYTLPEDRDDEQLANGFINNTWINYLNTRQTQVLPVAGGWLNVLEKFKAEYAPHLRMHSQPDKVAYIVLLIDFDEEYEKRYAQILQAIPEELKEQVFVIGVWDEPQDLREDLMLKKSFEEIGSSLADDCHHNTTAMWDHPHLKHNEPERIRLMKAAKSILFDP